MALQPQTGLSKALKTDMSGTPARQAADGSTEPRHYATKVNRKYVFEDFGARPQFSKVDGNGPATGALGDVNIGATNRGVFEWHVKVGQIILVPSYDVVNGKGLDFAQDQTATRGHEVAFAPNITTAGGDRGTQAFKVGDGDPFFVRLKMLSSGWANVNPFAFGLRKVQTYAAALATYTDYAVFKLLGTQINTETNLAGAGAVTKDTTQTKANNVVGTFELRVDLAGKVTFKLDDAAPTVSQAFSFAAGTILIPFTFFIQGAGLVANLWYQEFEAGYLPKKAV